MRTNLSTLDMLQAANGHSTSVAVFNCIDDITKIGREYKEEIGKYETRPLLDAVKSAMASGNTFDEVESAWKEATGGIDEGRVLEVVQEAAKTDPAVREWFNTTYGMSPLSHAIASGQVEVTQVLVSAGADVNVGYKGYPPLGYAVVDGHVEKALLTKY